MLHRLQPVARALVALPQRAGARSYGPGFKPEAQVATEVRSSMDNIPVPAGSWQEHYNKRNARWNMHLVGASLLLVASCFAAFQAGVWLPHQIKDYKKVKINPT